MAALSSSTSLNVIPSLCFPNLLASFLIPSLPSHPSSPHAPIFQNCTNVYKKKSSHRSKPLLSKIRNPISFITIAIPVCPRSVSCHPMGSMSFKALQAQPLPHCRSQDRSLSRETASSSNTTPRRRTTGTVQVGCL